MKNVLIFLVVAVVGKMITDSLPAIGIKELWRYFLRTLTYLTCMGVLLMIIVRVYMISAGKMSKQQQFYAGMLVIVAVSVVVWLESPSRILSCT